MSSLPRLKNQLVGHGLTGTNLHSLGESIHSHLLLQDNHFTSGHLQQIKSHDQVCKARGRDMDMTGVEWKSLASGYFSFGDSVKVLKIVNTCTFMMLRILQKTMEVVSPINSHYTVTMTHYARGGTSQFNYKVTISEN